MEETLKQRIHRELAPLRLTHEHRDENSVRRGEFNDEAMANILRSGLGHWRPYQAQGKAPTTCYEIDVDSMMMFTGMRLYFYKGDKLIPKQP